MGYYDATAHGRGEEGRRIRGCCRNEIGEEVTIQIDVFYRSSNGDRWELMRDSETGWQSVRHKPNLASGGHDTDTAVQEFLDRTGTSPENMALRALLEKLDDKV